MHQLEEQLNDVFTKKISYQIPDHARSTIVKFMPWLTLAGGILSLLGAGAAYTAITVVNRMMDGYLNMAYPYNYAPMTSASPLLWVVLLILLGEAILFFAAFPALRDHKRKGWLILYWVNLVYVLYALVHLIAAYDFANFIFSLLGSAVGLYILFQIRSYYTEAGAPAQVKPASPNDKKETPATKPKDKTEA
ncbi:MAG TPA: hypothetical protein VNG90_01965 [Candidatus Acidoferrum sp.]|nr:hypothetical protein [Candidatus Acidoferrum sp.]